MGKSKQGKNRFSLIGDSDLAVVKLYNMLPLNVGAETEGPTAVDYLTVRTVIVIGLDKQIRCMISYPMRTGGNFDEVIRLLDSAQLTARHQAAMPVNWKQGEDVIIVPAVSDDEAREKFPGGWKAPKPDLRIVPQPN